MEWTRRRYVGAVGAAAALAGCTGDDGPADGADDEATHQDGTGDDGAPSDVDAIRDEYEFADRTGDETVEITVDPENAAFDPEGVEIDASTTINWVWEGSSEDLYPLTIPEECSWEGTEGERSAGDEYDRLFWAEGGYVYASRDADGEEFTGAFLVRDDGDDE